MDEDNEDKVAIYNPTESNQVAYWGWGGKQYQLAPGESRELKTFLSEHARKNNPWLQIMDPANSAVEFAQGQVKAAETKVLTSRQALETAAEGLRRSQAILDQAKANLKAKQDEDDRLANEKRDAAQRLIEEEQNRQAAAAKAAAKALKA